jgi:heme-degrading monooxygenase HmoA
MAVKILITRKIPSEKAPQLMPLFKKMRSLATAQPGYIAGETLKRIDSPGEYLVISTWQSLDDWQTWVDHRERLEIQSMIDALIGQKTEYKIFGYA